jgi:hypothetical protein
MSAMQLPPQARANPPMFILGAVILVGVLGWMLFQAVDGLGLETNVAPAQVVAKGYREAGRTYVTQIINNRPLVVPQTTPEAWFFELDLSGARTEAVVTRETFERVQAGDQVIVSFARRRLTGGLTVVNVRPPGGLVP